MASVSRMVSFGRHPAAPRHPALLEVEREFVDASVPGARLGHVVTAGAEEYARNRFAPMSGDAITRAAERLEAAGVPGLEG
ncbi:hypothetical protein CGZ93_17370 [Enemella dayhoffiae]|uniref:Uncharacterized protein n=1 Tax=Enemella dayhoffiae TaxID=2016507 RepID=A0A255GPP2_9ACTN|nr:hypothetical protein [Enemella dayhoffiae]OYO16536.1 hypothetical protein CGZ93_17370 [Enemella dayhoffiae]